MTKIRTKKKCCKSGPRCKKCPVVYKRLETAGYVERLDKRDWLVITKVPKKQFKLARAR